MSTIPVSWYIGHVPVGDEWDTVPRPDAGNRITPREYQRRWLNTYAELMGNPGAYAANGGASIDAHRGHVGDVPHGRRRCRRADGSRSSC